MKQLELDRGERLGLLCGVIALIFVIFLAVYIPLGPKKQFDRAYARVVSLTNDIASAKVDKSVIEEQLASEEALKKQLESRSQNFDLFSFMNRLLKEQNILARATVENTRAARNQAENEVMVDVQMNGVSLAEVVNLLHTVYASENLVRMFKMEIRPMARDEGLHCEMTFMTVRV
ncbi:MAG: hypothetical protein HYV27_21570 [Candidatus Hydrogenedentes bacterium]|nr:hypothetical protein [Candidatus Hydrogenedentota bacterium]